MKTKIDPKTQLKPLLIIFLIQSFSILCAVLSKAVLIVDFIVPDDEKKKIIIIETILVCKQK